MPVRCGRWWEARLVPRREQEAYIDRVLEQVRFRFDHPAIRAELAAHLEDKTADLLRRDGTDAAAAEARAVAELSLIHI